MQWRKIGGKTEGICKEIIIFKSSLLLMNELNSFIELKKRKKNEAH